ncbi:toprim domain-containing protein, partial [Patescibacteria group bacterium]|nr:toprim domain-containing protein [Patescibacteria group bacterium]
PKNQRQELAEALEGINKSGFCRRCFNVASEKFCPICVSKDRDHGIVCVVEDVLDLMAIENQNTFLGVYHVLGGTIRVGQKDNTDKLTIKELGQRVGREKIKEIIIATNPTTAGDMTAIKVKEALEDREGLKITRISRGVPTGGDIEYADRESIAGSFKAREEI